MTPDNSLLTPDFEKYARLLDDLAFRKSARQLYEVMSGSVMWDDEKASIPFSQLGWFRAALAYRSSVILGKPRIEFEPVWRELQRVAPNWPGFRAERCTPNPALVEYLNTHTKNSMRQINRLDDALSERRKLLSGGKQKSE
jgi:hypothetical protein